MKKLSSIIWDIRWWMWHKSPLYINSLNIGRCYKEWCRWKKYFKKPEWIYMGRYRSNFSILRLEINELAWKTKYREPRHEEDPLIKLSFLFWTWRWRLGCKESLDSMIYWESILWLYDLSRKYSNKAEMIYKSIKNNTWGRKDECITAIPMLTGYAQHLYDTWSHHLICETNGVRSDSDTTVIDNDSED